MAVFVIVLLKVFDQEKYSIYEAGVPPIALRYGAQVVALGNGKEQTVLEGDWPYTRSLVLSFPDTEKMNAWYKDPEYMELMKLRHESATGQVTVLNGFGAQAVEDI